MMPIRVSSSSQIFNCGALSPENQEKVERSAIEQHPMLSEKIGNSIYRIEKTDTGYLVITDWCGLPVTVKYLPPEIHPIYGPICAGAKFELIFGEVTAS